MTSPRVDNATLQVQIESIDQRIERGFNDIKTMYLGYEDRLRKIEQSDASNHPLMETRLDAAWRKLEEHSISISNLQRTADTALTVANKLESIASWMLGIITAMIVGLAIAVITGRVELVIK